MNKHEQKASHLELWQIDASKINGVLSTANTNFYSHKHTCKANMDCKHWYIFAHQRIT